MLIKGVSNETQYCYWCDKVICKGDDVYLEPISELPPYCSVECYDNYVNYINHIVECAEEKIKEKKNKSKISVDLKKE